MAERCPTCGSEVEVHTGDEDEGSLSYVPSSRGLHLSREEAAGAAWVMARVDLDTVPTDLNASPYVVRDARAAAEKCARFLADTEEEGNRG